MRTERCDTGCPGPAAGPHRRRTRSCAGCSTISGGGEAVTWRRAGLGMTRFHHALVGELVLDWDTFTCGSDPDQELETYLPDPGRKLSLSFFR
ncbi:hypothetical protein ACFYRY_06235 [Streptomyces sp. NPDC005263]|uniref:MmyB family transcriptional regulator n=1 Tax=Streptomyces sp. NPDC005263 TaxID=3364711 RepID=UPI00369968E2